MPEGDTIFRTAATLRPAIEGGRIAAARVRDGQFEVSRIERRVVAAVEARGKHLLMHLAADSTTPSPPNGAEGPVTMVLHSHMGMTGSWHVYHPDQRWLKPASYAALTLAIDRSAVTGPSSSDSVATPSTRPVATPGRLDVICFSPKQLELLTADQFRHHRHIQQLGPDLLASRFDMESAIARFRVRNDLPLGEAVMSQSLVCGIGNIYKSEVLFVMRFDPFAPVARYADDELTEMLAAARRLMRLNCNGGARVTRFGSDAGRHWMYGRSGQPCPKCGATIQLRRQGDAGRTTYWCPACQPSRAG